MVTLNDPIAAPAIFRPPSTHFKKILSLHKSNSTSTMYNSMGTAASEISLYHFYIKDHLGNNRMVLSASGAVEQVTHYYPYGLPFSTSTNPDLQPYKYNGKELDTKDQLNWMDYGARMYDPSLARWTSVDRYAEKYYALSPYSYCGGNPIANIDVNGDSIDVSGLSEENLQWYGSLINYLSSSTPFRNLYSYLESSSQIYTIETGETSKNDGGAHFLPRGSNGTIKFDSSRATAASVTEEMFHAFQNEKTKSGEYTGSYNPEFEAKSFSIYVLADLGLGFEEYGGFPAEYIFDILLNPVQDFSSNVFDMKYIENANAYAQFNRNAQKGNIHYMKNTSVPPYCLKMLLYKNKK